MITLDDYLMGRDKKFPNDFNDDILKNAKSIVAKASEVLSAFGEKRKVTSGWRPPTINKMNNGAPKSQHMYGNAIDIEDGDGRLKKWCVTNIERLVELGLYMESPTATPSWVHLQQVAPRSGNRIFVP
jgi:uncharacterized protein YcbK (DUF882 family)